MRKITMEAQKAFWNNGYFKHDNTIVLNGTMTLYRTMIAVWGDGVLTLDCKGYRSKTTKERLNGVLERMGYQIRQRKGEWYVYNSQTEENVLFYDGMQFHI